MTAELQARFDKSLRLYAELGFPIDRTVQQLLRAGFPVELVRSQFPAAPEALFTAPVAAPSRMQMRLTPHGQAPPPGSVVAASTAHVAQRVLARTTPAPTSAHTATVTATVTAAPTVPLPMPPNSVTTDAISDGISFQYVPLIQCSFPHADPGTQHQFTRRNGWLELTLSTARPETGLPYGVPARLLTIYCASEAVRTRSPEIFLGGSLHEFLRRVDVPITRGERGSLSVYANQLLRLIHCALSIDENIRDGAGRQGIHIRQTLFVQEARLWWDESQPTGQGSSLVLSPVLFDSILERSAPLSTRAIRQLRKSPMDLDVYAWLVHRLHQLGKPSTISWPQLSGQFGHSYSLLRKFRAFFGTSLKRVLEIYPEARVKLSPAGLVLLPSKPHIPRDALVTSR